MADSVSEETELVLLQSDMQSCCMIIWTKAPKKVVAEAAVNMCSLHKPWKVSKQHRIRMCLHRDRAELWLECRERVWRHLWPRAGDCTEQGALASIREPNQGDIGTKVYLQKEGSGFWGATAL